jgi:hypothetical protein
VVTIPNIYACEIKYKDARRAIASAKTAECKAYLANITCQIQSGTMFAKTQQRTCPLRGKKLTRNLKNFAQRKIWYKIPWLLSATEYIK